MERNQTAIPNSLSYQILLLMFSFCQWTDFFVLGTEQDRRLFATAGYLLGAHICLSFPLSALGTDRNIRRLVDQRVLRTFIKQWAIPNHFSLFISFPPSHFSFDVIQERPASHFHSLCDSFFLSISEWLSPWRTWLLLSTPGSTFRLPLRAHLQGFQRQTSFPQGEEELTLSAVVYRHDLTSNSSSNKRITC